jgi:hypothetical protein
MELHTLILGGFLVHDSEKTRVVELRGSEILSIGAVVLPTAARRSCIRSGHILDLFVDCASREGGAVSRPFCGGSRGKSPPELWVVLHLEMEASRLP